jgi:hypothetical protein
MSSKSRTWMGLGFSTITVVVLGALSGLTGCNPRSSQLRPENLFGRIGRQSGQLIEPRKCMLRVAILNRSIRDPAINEAVWKVADQQVIAPEARRALEVNGLRIGLITGELPPELESVFDAPPPHKVEPATFLLDDGEQTLISSSDAADQVSLLMNRDNRPLGKDYQTASGFFRVTATQDGTNGVALRFIPEIHHGPVQRSYQAIGSAASYAPQQFKINDGQQEETLRDLAANLIVEPGQVAVVGCCPEQERSLGTFLLTQAQSHGDPKRQKLILVWASRNLLGAIGEKGTTTDRPMPSTSSERRSPGLDKPAGTTMGQASAPRQTLERAKATGTGS